MQLMVALAPIHRAAGIERLVVSTYQSVSGTGQKAIAELDAQAHASLHGMEMPAPELYPEPIAFNVIGAAGSFPDGDDHTDEERKMMFETRKILDDESIGVAVTCVRVPVRVCHSEAVNVQTREPLSAAGARELLARAPGVLLEDLPTPLHAEGRDEVFVGRVRELDALGELRRRAHAERRPAVAVITGQPGSGKTRLLGEATRGSGAGPSHSSRRI